MLFCTITNKLQMIICCRSEETKEEECDEQSRTG